MIRRSWMTGASIEATLELWASSLRDVKGRMRPLFTQERVAASAGSFLDGLLGAEPRKTGWMRAEAAGDRGPWRQQAILGRGRWDADALRDIVRDYALETLADPDAVLVLDETGFLKQGKPSCGVGRQYTGSARQDHELPDRRVRRLCVAPWPRLHRPSVISAQGLDGRPGADGGGSCAGAHRLCDQASPCSCDDRSGDRGKRALRLGCGRHRLRGWRDRKSATARRQRLCAWRAGQPPVPIMGQTTADRRDGVRNRALARPFVMETPIGWRRNQRRKTARLGLLRTG